MLLMVTPPAPAEDREKPDPSQMSWDRAYVQLGVFFTTLDSTFRLGN